MEKRCVKCGEIKPLTEYYANKAMRDGHGSYCKTCSKASVRAGQIAHRDRTLSTKKRYREANRDQILDKQRIYREANKERINEGRRNKYAEQKKKYRNENIDRVRVWAKRYRDTHKEGIQAYRRSRSGLESNRKANQKRRAALNATMHNLTSSEWTSTCDEFGWRCAYCDKPVSLFKPHQEHFIPLSSGGDYTKSNIIPACKSCNSSKGNKNYFEWIKTRKTKPNPALAPWIARYHPELSSKVGREQGTLQAGELV